MSQTLVPIRDFVRMSQAERTNALLETRAWPFPFAADRCQRCGDLHADHRERIQLPRICPACARGWHP